MRCLFKYQPIDAIREYFGEKLALYFSWIGLYTMFLVPASIVGIICFIYGVLSSMGELDHLCVSRCFYFVQILENDFVLLRRPFSPKSDLLPISGG